MNFDWKSRLPLLIRFTLLLATVALYWPVLHSDFINYDDWPYVVGNSHVHAGLTFETCRWAFNVGYACNWHPLTWLSHMADCQFFGLDPRGHHLTNLLLHLANTLLLFGVLSRMTGAGSGRQQTGGRVRNWEALWGSALVAALFAWHPLHVQSVAWVAERKDLLSTFFFMLTLWCYARYVEDTKAKAESRKQKAEIPNHASRITDRASRFYLLSLLLFALGLMSKPMLVTLPLVLLLLDYWPLHRFEPVAAHGTRRMLRSLLLEKIPFFTLAVCSCGITLVAQERGGAVVPLQVIPFDARCWNALVSYLRYVGKLFWPSDLAAIYPYVYRWPWWLISLAVAFLLAVSLFALKLRRSAPYLPVGWFWFLGTLVPVIGLVQVGEQAMADRYSYIPSIGLFIIVNWAILQLAARSPRWRPALAFGAALALVACGWTTRLQMRYWVDGVTLFEHALAVTENNAVAHATLGLALMDKGKVTEAVAQYDAALRISPEYSLAHNNLGAALARLARFDEAIAHYQTALQINPQDAEAHFNLANALNPGFVDTYPAGGSVPEYQTDAQQAREQYQAALSLHPRYLNAHINWGNLELALGRPDVAISHYQDALRIDPLAALAHFNLGNALAQMGKTNEALGAYTRAVELEPGDALARLRLANLLASQGDFEKAIPHYRQVLKLSPGHFVACCNLGSALAKLGRLQEASRCFAEAIRIQPKYPDAHANLGKFLALQGQLEQAAQEYSEAARLEPENSDLHCQAALLLVQLGKIRDAIPHFSARTRLHPNDPAAHCDLALALVKTGESGLAVEHLRTALRVQPDWVQAMNNLAWLLAADADERVRNGAEALGLATRACALTGYKEPQVLGTLDAAYAEAGRFADAIQAAQKTCELAEATGKPDLANKARARLKLYQAGRPFHESARIGESP